MKSMFLIFYMLINSMGGYLFQQTAVETAYPDIARRCPDLTLHDTNDLVDGSGWISFLKGLDTVSLSTIRIKDARDSTQDFLIRYDALGKSYTLTRQDDSEHAVTYSHLIRMDGQRIADMQLDDMCICFANNPAEYWYWYLCDDVNVKPQDIFREPNSTKAQLLFTVKKT